ncbi:PucR family transcriptional regulator [Leuconostoc carnosum]|uniref:PucR family transcriptional regulator n=1 Tax=Leuconostoc carnosum TaxID=1252 RepID=UPI00123BE411|nr:PucR family transcriptional regulator ligand-binding domain-containing protein [Leuconostoc carnosum]KAA8370988.1 PucR family transcriptional regulator [Leuconostoc carnosum]KAA8382632.1 PucR family transcriptional regulator [Leuconostoc carnosum]
MQLNSFLKDPLAPSFELIAGQNGLNREINHVGIVDTPNFEEYLVPDQFIVTTGYLFQNHNDRLRQLIISLDKHHSSGIGIKANRHMNTIDHDIQELANQHHILMIWLLDDEPMSTTFTKINQIINATHNNELHEIVTINQQLSFINHHNTYQHLLDLSAQILDAPLMLLDSHFSALYASNALLKEREFFTSFLRTQSNIDYLNLQEKVIVTFKGKQFDILPIFSALNENKAFVAIQAPSQPLSDFQLLKRSQVINAVGLANSRTDLINETEFRNLSGFFLNIMQGDLGTEAINHYLRNINIDVQTQYAIAVLDFTTSKSIIEIRQFEILQTLTRWFINESDWPVLIFSYKQQLVLLIADVINPRIFLQNLYNFLRKQSKLEHRFTIGFSRITETIHKLNDLYEQANNALKLTSKSHPIMRFRPKSAHELLNLLPQQESRAFVEKNLGPILDNPELLQTLETYMFLHQNVTAVASAMFVHRNTINYRLKHISELLDVNLDMPDVLVDIQLAILLLN